MEAIIGRYRVQVLESGINLRHVSGIAFDLNVDETVGLMDILNAYRQTFQSIQSQQVPTSDSDTDETP